MGTIGVGNREMSDRIEEPQGARGRIRNAQDFWGGVVLIGLALIAFYASWDLPGMRGFSFGPGTTPRLFAGLLMLLGVVIAAIGLTTDGPAMPRFAIRGPLLVTSAILLFALMIRPLGLVVSSFLMFMFAASGSSETRWIETTFAAIALTAFCTILFVYMLGLPFQLWPRFTIGGTTIAF